jgi:hypothetical protein
MILLISGQLTLLTFAIGLLLCTQINFNDDVLATSDLSAPVSNDAINNTQWSTYNSSKLGFSIEYPSTWDVHEKQSRFEQGTDLTISSPDPFSPLGGQFDASVIGKSPTTNVMMLTNTAINEIVVDYFDVDYEKRLIENANLTRYTIDGERAGTFVSVLQDKEDDLNLGTASETVVTVHNGTGYILQFFNSAENFDTPETTDIRQHMFESIKWFN